MLGCAEYVFSIKRRKDDIYCGASYNIPLDIGMMSGGQYFRIRNFDDNKEPFCGFHCDFSYEPLKKNPVVPIAECRLGKCVNTGQGLFWGLKRFDDGMIVLQGCGNEEYVYKRDGENTESFIFE